MKWWHLLPHNRYNLEYFLAYHLAQQSNTQDFLSHQKGYKVRAILEKYEGEKLVERKLLRRVTYQPTQGVKVVGAKKRPTQNKENNLDKNIVYFWQNLF